MRYFFEIEVEVEIEVEIEVEVEVENLRFNLLRILNSHMQNTLQ